MYICMQHVLFQCSLRANNKPNNRIVLFLRSEKLFSSPLPVSQMDPSSHSSERQPDASEVVPGSPTNSSLSTSGTKHDLQRAPTLQTRYMDMLLSLDNIPRSHNILVACSTWVFLAGFVIFPGTFTSLQASESFKDDEKKSGSPVEQAIVRTVHNTPLLWVAGGCCALGWLGMAALW